MKKNSVKSKSFDYFPGKKDSLQKNFKNRVTNYM